uniref:Uncharacterized protein n=1 Tax=mine drainage metagenome TaxID=410659 RepID=E6QJK4_9ZZZZ
MVGRKTGCEIQRIPKEPCRMPPAEGNKALESGFPSRIAGIYLGNDQSNNNDSGWRVFTDYLPACDTAAIVTGCGRKTMNKGA